MKYLPMKHKMISLNGKEQTELDAGLGMILIPDEGSKFFLHWKNDTGKLTATYTMTFPTKVEGNISIINALDKQAKIKAI